MNRRGMFKSLVAAGAGLIAARAAKAQEARATKCVYHLADAEKAAFVIGNLRNHLEGAGAIELAVVVHGPALRAFLKDAPNRAVIIDVGDLMASGVAFHACAHTLAAQHWTLDDLRPGFRLAEKGGVVLLADLQAQGWAYLRP